MPTRQLLAHGVWTLLVLGWPYKVTAQAADAGASDAAALPRFTLHEIVAGRNDTLTRIPGRWAGAPDRLGDGRPLARVRSLARPQGQPG